MAARLTQFLVRHGQSEANLDNSVNVRMADHAIPLSVEGHRQARAAGEYLARTLKAATDSGESVRVGFYRSPYLRARQTDDAIVEAMLRLNGEAWFAQHVVLRKESIFLRELEFGLFDGIPDKDLPAKFPLEHALYAKHKAFEGEFYATMPLGESRCRVAERVHQVFGTIQRDVQRHGITHAIVPSHGVTLRQYAMMWCDLGVAWVEKQKNPRNCSVRAIVDGDLAPTNDGYVFAGFEKDGSTPEQNKREDGVVE